MRQDWEVPNDWDEVCPWGITLEQLKKLPITPTPQKFPSLIKEAKNLAGCVGRAAKALVTHKKVLAPTEIRAERIAICEKCEYFAKDAVRCYKCGCKLFAKVALATEACPEGKWLKTNEVPEWQELLP